MYDLRSRSVKGAYPPKQISYHYTDGDKKKQVKIVLNRLPILETPSNHDSAFQVQNEEVMIKKNVVKRYKITNKMIILSMIFITLFISILAMYYKDDYNSYGSQIRKGFQGLRNRFKKIRLYLVNNVNMVWEWTSEIREFHSVMKNKTTSNKRKRKNDVCYNDIKDIINEVWFKGKPVENIMEKQLLPFIEEQCRIMKFPPKIADYAQGFIETYNHFDVNSLIDYASHERGARILSVSGTEPYVEYKLQPGILRYILGIENIRIDELTICQRSNFLCRYFNTGPFSVLQPWNKPGECWSFKGTRGRVQIELTEPIYITAISLEHIPENFVSPEKMLSAPAQFSIIGLSDCEDCSFTSRTYLGTYKYLLHEPNIQTFRLSKEDSSYPYKRIEFNVESNHGNENYTCVYRLRVHGRPITSIEN